MQDETMHDHQAQWAEAVGRFAIAMGEIEMAVNTAGLLLLDLDISRLALFDAIQALSEKLQALDMEAARDFRACLPEADALRVLRNTILHSPVNWMVTFEGLPTDEPLVITPDFDDSALKPIYISVLSDRKRKHVGLDLSKVRQYAQRASDLADRMYWQILVQEWARREELKSAP